MFVALEPATRERVVSLDERLTDSELQARCRSGQLVCPECHTAIHVKGMQGHQRRHFVHDSRNDCPLESDDSEIAEALPVLYDWLNQKYPGCVRVQERRSDIPGLPRPIDLCLVRGGVLRTIYWLFPSTGLRKQARVALRDALDSKGVVWVFVGALEDDGELEEEVPGAESPFASEAAEPMEADEPWPWGEISLRSTHRYFLRITRYDEVDRGSLGSIYFLDPGAKTLTTYRRLWLVHSPKKHVGAMISSPLSSLQIHPEDGEPFHLGEAQWLSTQSTRGKTTVAKELERAAELARCQKCGEMKIGQDQPTYLRKTNECICRACAYPGRVGRT